MPRDGAKTRVKILDVAEGMMLGQGFVAMSVDQIIAQAGVTKGTFFYHFPSKADLALALVERYAARDAEQLAGAMARAERLARDPLDQVLVFVGLFQEEFEALAEPHPGCLFAAYVYQAQLFDSGIMGIIRRGLARWREQFGAKLEEVMRLHPPRMPTTAATLADMLLAVFEGGLVMSLSMREPRVIADQLGQYRNYLELLFPRAELAS